MTDLTNHLAQLAKLSVPRWYSDDYEESESSIPSGQGYSVQVGDVFFRFKFRNLDLSSIALSCEHVLMGSFSTETQAIKWEHHSATLESHLNSAAQQLLSRIATAEAERQSRGEEAERRKAAHQQDVLRRFGIE